MATTKAFEQQALAERLAAVEQRHAHVEGVVNNMDQKLDKLIDAMSSLVRIEERQQATGDRLAMGAQTFQDHESRLRRVEQDIPNNLDKRLSAIEMNMPGLKELRKWVIMGVLGGLGMMGAALIKLVLIGG